MTLIQLRRDDAADWAAVDPILDAGEPGWDSTNNVFKIGDGVTAWSALPPPGSGGSGPVATFAPIVHRKNDGNITITPAAANTWFDVDPTGSVVARDLDIVFPDVAAGQKVDLQLVAQMTNVVNAFQFDFWSIVGGNPVNHISLSAFGLLLWTVAASIVTPFGGVSYPFAIQAGDIDNGDLRMRLRYRSGGTTPRDIACLAAGGTELVLVGRGPFG